MENGISANAFNNNPYNALAFSKTVGEIISGVNYDNVYSIYATPATSTNSIVQIGKNGAYVVYNRALTAEEEEGEEAHEVSIVIYELNNIL